MDFKKNDYVRIVAPNGEFRYGYVSETQEHGWHLIICMHDEGESGIAFQEAESDATGVSRTDWLEELTPAEKRLLPYLAEGMSTTVISDSMSLSPVTVRTQIRSLRTKLKLDTNTQLQVFARGLIKTLEPRE